MIPVNSLVVVARKTREKLAQTTETTEIGQESPVTPWHRSSGKWAKKNVTCRVLRPAVDSDLAEYNYKPSETETVEEVAAA